MWKGLYLKNWTSFKLKIRKTDITQTSGINLKYKKLREIIKINMSYNNQEKIDI